MTIISLRFNERNMMAMKTIEYILSLGLFTKVETVSASKRRTLKAIDDMRKGKDVTKCDSFEDYLKAVAK